MKNLVITMALLAVPIIVFSQKQDSILGKCDTIHLKETVITSKLALDNKDIIDFYRTNHFSTLDDINARLDGMMLIKRGAYAMEPQLNGFSGGQLNVTIDGMKMFGACTDKMDPITSYIEPSNLKNIKISQGTNGCQNGCSNGGSIDMTLMEPGTQSSRPFYGSAAFGYESVANSRNVLASTGYAGKKWAWGIDGVYRKNDNYRDGKNRIVPFSQYEKLNLHSVLRYSPNGTNSFKVDALYDVALNVGYPALPMDVKIARAQLYAFEYLRTKRSQIKLKVYYNSIYHLMDDSQRDSTFFLHNKETGVNDTVFMRMDMPGWSATLGTYLQMIIPLGKKNILTLKVDDYANNALAEMTMYMHNPPVSPEPPMYMQTWPAMLRNVTGIFIKNTTTFSRKLTLGVDGRIDNNLDILQSKYGQQQFSVFNYKLNKTHNMVTMGFNAALQYQMHQCLSMMVTLGYAQRVPTLSERMGFYLYNAYDGYDYIGRPDIRSEKSKFAGLIFKFSKPKLKMNLNQVFTYTNDYIIGLTDTLIPVLNFYAKGIRRYTNIKSSTIYSVDLQVLYNPLKSLTFFLLAKYTYGVMYTGEPLPMIAPFKNVIAIQYQVKRFSVQLENQTSLRQGRINSNYAETATPGFTLFNIKGSYLLPVKKFTFDFSLGMTNILGATYYEHLDVGHIYRPGRSLDVYLKISY